MGTHPIFESDFDCLTEMSDGFYNSNWDQTDQNQVYDNQAYSNSYDPNAYGQQQQYGQYDQSAYSAPTQQSYGGQMFTPGDGSNTGPSSGPNEDVYAGGFEDEPPLLEELGINFDHIYQKTVAVLNPWKTTDSSVVNEVDLTGPFVFCMALGAAMLMVGKVQFGYIYGIGAVGVFGMWLLLNVMAPKGAHVGVIASVLGYCILPIVLLSIINILVDLQGVVGTFASGGAVCWCAISASKLFSDGLEMKRQQILVAYPCGILYAVFALLTVF